MSADNGRMGWVCAVCGRGVAPFSFVCDHGGVLKEAPTPIDDIIDPQEIVDAQPIVGRKSRRRSVKRGLTNRGMPRKLLPKGALKRWALAQGVGDITAERASKELRTSLGSAEQTFLRLIKEGLFTRVGKRTYHITNAGMKAAKATPAGTWTR